MMAIVAISLPELVILRRVMKPRLIAVFVGVVVAGILAVGYLFNALVAWLRRSPPREEDRSPRARLQQLPARSRPAAREAVAMAGIEAEIIKVTDYAEIAAYGVLSHARASSSTARS